MSVLQVGDHPEDVGYAQYGQLGAAHSVSSEAPDEDEAVRKLRQVVEEITRKPAVEEPPPRRIGFV